MGQLDKSICGAFEFLELFESSSTCTQDRMAASRVLNGNIMILQDLVCIGAPCLRRMALVGLCIGAQVESDVPWAPGAKKSMVAIGNRQ